MSILFASGMDHAASVLEVFDAQSNMAITTSTVRTGTRGLTTGTGNSNYALKNLSGTPATIIVAFGFYLGGAPAGANGTIMYLRESGSLQFGIRINAAGKLSADRAGTILATMAGAGLSVGRWYHIEVKITIHPSAGTYEIRVDGVNVLSGTGANTRNTANSYCDQVQFGWATDPQGGCTMIYDDMVIMDTNGSVNNDFCGDRFVYPLYPSGAGNSTQWTPSAGSNYAAVDETPQNSDTDYVASATLNQIDTYAFGNLPANAATVSAVVAVAVAKKTDAGARSIALVARPSATDRVGSDVALSTGYTDVVQIWETSPETAAAWTVSEVNGSEFGVKLTV